MWLDERPLLKDFHSKSFVLSSQCLNRDLLTSLMSTQQRLISDTCNLLPHCICLISDWKTKIFNTVDAFDQHLPMLYAQIFLYSSYLNSEHGPVPPASLTSTHCTICINIPSAYMGIHLAYSFWVKVEQPLGIIIEYGWLKLSQCHHMLPE